MTDEPVHTSQALIAELQHRVRNTLALIRMLVRRSAETDVSLSDYVMHLEGRLDALAGIQNTFISDPLGSIDLGLLIINEVHRSVGRSDKQVNIEGDPVGLHPRAAEALGLAVHELVTNASKFGALATPAGRVAVSWWVDASGSDPTLSIVWEESGVASIDRTPTHVGFGRSVLEDMLPHNLKAKVILSFGAEGLTCRIDVPWTERNVVTRREPSTLTPFPSRGVASD